MDPTAIKPWLDLLANPGLAIIISSLVIWLAIKYLPKWIDGSIEAGKAIPVALNGVNETLKDGIEIMKSVQADSTAARQDLDKIKDALGHGASAAEAALRAAPQNVKQHIPEQVTDELRRMKDATHNHGHEGR